MAVLRFIDDAGRIQIRSLDMEHFTVGRDAGCDLTFDSDTISREHVRISLEREGRYRIRDLGSRNKTHVNGELISETLLSPGDILRVGDRVLEFVDETDGRGRKLDTSFFGEDSSEPPNTEWVKVRAPVTLTVGQIEQLSQLYGDQPLTARAEDIAGAALSQVLLDLQADRGFVALRGDDKLTLNPVAQRGLAPLPGSTRVPVNKPFALSPLLQNVASRYPQTSGQINVRAGYPACAVVAPLMYRGDVIGVIYVDRPHSKRPFPGAAIQYLLGAGAHIGAMLGEAARKLSRYAPREGLAWITNIRRVQSSLSPKIASSESFTVVSHLFPGRARCGDMADVIHIDEYRCALMIVDGGGHGFEGIALAHSLLASARSAVSVFDEVVTDPADLFNTFNHMLSNSDARQILPCLFIGLDMSTGKLSYINSGVAPPALMVSPGRMLTLDQTTLVLGVDPDYLYETTRVDLPERFRLIAYTDGLIEASNAGGDALTAARLHESLLEPEAFESAQRAMETIQRSMQGHLGGGMADDDGLAVVVGHG